METICYDAKQLILNDWSRGEQWILCPENLKHLDLSETKFTFPPRDQKLSDLLYSKTKQKEILKNVLRFHWQYKVTFNCTLWSRAKAVSISRVTLNCFSFDVIVFAMFPAHILLRSRNNTFLYWSETRFSDVSCVASLSQRNRCHSPWSLWSATCPVPVRLSPRPSRSIDFGDLTQTNTLFVPDRVTRNKWPRRNIEAQELGKSATWTSPWLNSFVCFL